MSGRCRVCRCTEREPCEPPCEWSEADLCSSCSDTIATVADWLSGAHKPNQSALLREAAARLLQ